MELLQARHDPLTIGPLDAIGVGEGWRCLDVGAGGGSVARILAERVGAAARETIERMRAQTITLGADPGEIDEAQRLFADPVNTITVPTVCAARGRRPR